MGLLQTNIIDPAASSNPQASPEPKLDATPSQLDVLTKRLNDLGTMVVDLRSKLGEQKPTQSATAGEPVAPAKRVEGFAAIEEKLKAISDREAEVDGRDIRSAIMSSLIHAGMEEESAKVLIPAVQASAKFFINKNREVVASDETGAEISARDFVKVTMMRDGWRSLIPAKAGAKPLPRNSGASSIHPGAGGTVQPNEHGVYSGAAVRAAAGM